MPIQVTAGAPLIPDWLAFILVGAFAGFIRDLVSAKGVILLPKFDGTNLNLGVLVTVLVGGFTGYLGPYILPGLSQFTGTIQNPIPLAAIAGYIGLDFLDNLTEKVGFKTNMLVKGQPRG